MPESSYCRECGTEIAPGLLACPGCHRLIYGDRLKDLGAVAGRLERDGDTRGALVAWREALELLPENSTQYEQVESRISTLGRSFEQAPAPAATTASPTNSSSAPGWSGGAGAAGLGAIGVMLFKFKFALLLIIPKLKLLLIGLTKAKTFLSMLAYFGVYWARFGWQFGLGLVASIYVHEMGHVWLLNRYGVKTDAPMFIPGLGAFIRLKQALSDVHQDARVGLAGPVWGLAAASSFAAASFVFDAPVLAAIAKLGAFVNLFNMIPVWQLDGGRAFRALSRSQRWLAGAAVGLAWATTGEGLLFLVLLGVGFRALSERGPEQPDRQVLIEYVGLIGAFTLLMMIPVAL